MDNNEDRMRDMSHEQLRRIYDSAKRSNEDKYKNNSKKRLIANLTKKFEICIIGSLATCEDGFGKLWGHKSDRNRDLKEQEWYDIWQEVRTNILNNGHKQLRAALNEIAEYTMTWDRYKAEFIIKKGLNNE